MCGIAGIFAYSDSAPPVGPEEILKIREAEGYKEFSRQRGLRGWARLMYGQHTGVA